MEIRAKGTHYNIIVYKYVSVNLKDVYSVDLFYFNLTCITDILLFFIIHLHHSKVNVKKSYFYTEFFCHHSRTTDVPLTG